MKKLTLKAETLVVASFETRTTLQATDIIPYPDGCVCDMAPCICTAGPDCTTA